MDQLALLKQVSFGARVAEEETNELASYFVETDQWNRIARGEIDVIRGDKGAGKSAIYSLLMNKADEFFDKNILLAAAEKPRGTPVFKDLVADPPTSEVEFVALWKLYILTLIAESMRDFGVGADTAAAKKVFSALEGIGLLPREFDLAGILHTVIDYARRMVRAESIEGGLKLDPVTGMPDGVSGKITFREPGSNLRDAGFSSVDSLLGQANEALSAAGYQVWVLLDRLDVAFVESHDLERNALRALFRAYRDLSEHAAIKLKIFLRSDIWDRITEAGFREASHITRFVILEWNSSSLLNLVVKRLLKNDVIVTEFAIDRENVLSDFNAQRDLFYRFFPAQVEQGRRKASTFDWMVSRCADGQQKTAPREVIHLLNSIREKEIGRLERGESPSSGEQLFDRSVFKEALPDVSEARLVQNLYAEYPDLSAKVRQLKGEKTEQTMDSLATIWQIEPAEASQIAEKLTEVGFFQLRGSRSQPTFWVPFLYRDGLQMIQGMADEPEDDPGAQPPELPELDRRPI